MKRALILANGPPPGRRLFRKARRLGGFFVCADGGANAAAAMKERPDLIIGDLDSIKASVIRTFRSVPTRKIADQNSTDLEKALVWLTRRKFTPIDVFGALGGRVDHLVGNLSALGKFSRFANIRFIGGDGVMVPVRSGLTITASPGTTVSLLPLSRCEGIVTRGLKWELRNETLELGVREGTSNVVRASPVSIRVRRGILLAYIMADPESSILTRF